MAGMIDVYDRHPTPPDHTGMNTAAFLLMLGGWGGLYLLVTSEIPRVGPRWIFFVLLFTAICSTLIPFVRYLYVRFTPLSRELPSSGVIVRECVWVGLFVVACAWLQMPRVLSAPIAFFLALALVVIEVFLRLREIPHERAEAGE